MITRRTSNFPRWDRRNPFEELEEMRRQFNRLFEDLPETGYQKAGVFPLLNITENNDNYYIRAELPGLKSDELDISVTGNSMSIAGERKIPSEGENIKYHRRERESGYFNRIINLPGRIDPEKVEANLVNGILIIVLSKEEASKPKKISVK